MRPLEHIIGSDQLTAVFGRWPSFHDAEVIEIGLHRRTGEDGGPTLDALIHLFQMTSELTPTGHYALTKHHLVRLRFVGVDELHMEGFNHQNALFNLVITEPPPGSPVPHGFEVVFESSYGVGASFHCWAIEVVAIVPCDEDGRPTENAPNP